MFNLLSIAPGTVMPLMGWSHDSPFLYTTTSFDEGSGIWTCPVTGKYSFKASTEFNYPTGTVFAPQFLLFINDAPFLDAFTGVQPTSIENTSGTGQMLTMTADIFFNEGDTAFLEAINSDSVETITLRSDYTRFSIHRFA